MASNGRIQHHHFGTQLPCGFNAAPSGRGSPFYSLGISEQMGKIIRKVVLGFLCILIAGLAAVDILIAYDKYQMDEGIKSAKEMCSQIPSGTTISEAVTIANRSTLKRKLIVEVELDRMWVGFKGNCRCNIRLKEGKTQAVVAWCRT